MNGETAARVLADHFEAVRRSELARLRKKLVSLRAEDRAAVEAMTAQVVRALAPTPARALTCDDSPLLVRTLVDLFHVS
jgi:hypothetical protein